MMSRCIAISIFFLSGSICSAQGWRDYSLDIGDGYHIFRANSMDVCIGKTDGSLILSPRDYNNVGPLYRYLTTPEHILTTNHGRTPRDAFEGDEFEEIDSSQKFYFVIFKENDEVIGPLSETDFLRQPEVAGLGSLDWKTPKNPDFWLPISGSLIFIAISIPILAVIYWWITIPLFIGLIFLIRDIIRRRKEAAQSIDPKAHSDSVSGKSSE